MRKVCRLVNALMILGVKLINGSVDNLETIKKCSFVPINAVFIFFANLLILCNFFSNSPNFTNFFDCKRKHELFANYFAPFTPRYHFFQSLHFFFFFKIVKKIGFFLFLRLLKNKEINTIIICDNYASSS